MLYDYPEYYEVAFSFRDIPREAHFLDDCIRELSKRKVNHILEIACGHAPHVEQLSLLGYRYTGLDINRNMLDYAIYKWKDIKPIPIFIEEDMVSFSSNESYDFAYVLLGSLYLNSLDEMQSHFDSISKVLNSGGLYFLDWCVQFHDPLKDSENNSYSLEKDGIIIESDFNIKLLDHENQMYEEIWTVNVNDHGRHKKFNMIERNKAILPEEFRKFIKNRTDFEIVGMWGDWYLNQPIIDHNEVSRPIIIIRKI